MNTFFFNKMQKIQTFELQTLNTLFKRAPPITIYHRYHYKSSHSLERYA